LLHDFTNISSLLYEKSISLNALHFYGCRNLMFIDNQVSSKQRIFKPPRTYLCESIKHLEISACEKLERKHIFGLVHFMPNLTSLFYSGSSLTFGDVPSLRVLIQRCQRIDIIPRP
jgi:uncharacterized protein YlaI